MIRRATTEIAVYLVIITAIIALMGCTPDRPVIVKPPVELTTCAPEPIAPVLPGREEQAARDMLIGVYVLALVDAGADCRARVDAIKAWADAL
jgi:hypothetical protein